MDSEFSSVVQFLNQNLRPQAAWSIQAEYPTVINTHNLNNIRIIKDGQTVLSHAALKPMIIKSPVGLMKMAGIGSVVTSSEHRNRGLSRQIIEDCLVAARNHGCDFAILWTDLFDFYRKMGFELAGSEVSFVIDKPLSTEIHGLTFRETTQVAPEAIHRLYGQHTVISLRTIAEIQQYLQIPQTHVYTAWDAQGTLQAYAIEGKGADLNGYIHEWGGTVSALTALLSHVVQKKQKTLVLIAPAHSENLRRQLEGKNVKMHEGFLGMIKILNHQNLFAKIKKHARQKGIADFVLERQGEQTYIGTADELFRTDSDSDLVRLIFGPQKASQIHDFSPGARQSLESILPIPMWVWGWDSV